MNKSQILIHRSTAVIFAVMAMATVACSSVKKSTSDMSYTILVQHKAIHEKMLSEQSRLAPKSTTE